MGFKVGLSSGMYTGTNELTDAIAKIGANLTKGTNVIEVACNVPHEVDFSSGREMRYIAERQGLELAFHGSLTVPMTEGDKEEWDTGALHIKLSTRSAIFAGAKYVLFHASLRLWPELLTRAETKVRVVMVDENGKLLKEKLKDEKLRKWFIEKMGFDYASYIINNIDMMKIRQISEIEAHAAAEKDKNINVGEKFIENYKKHIKEYLDVYLKEGREWETYDIGNFVDVYLILATYMLLNRDPLLVEMEKAYGGRIKIDWNNQNWFYDNYKKANIEGGPSGLLFKEFFYASVGAKYLEGHMADLFNNGISQIKAEIKSLPISEDEKTKLTKLADSIVVVLETPDAREPSHAGLYTLWRPRQIIAAIIAFRKNKPWGSRVFANVDFEHLVTQGVDPKFELQETRKVMPNFGEYILSVHSGYPSPLHSHRPINIGEVKVYELLWELRLAGLGKNHDVYVIFERGGGEDPFKQSITALRIFVDHLEKDISPDKLPLEFFGISSGEEKRQFFRIKEHALDPLKGLLMVPEEEYGFLGTSAVERGKKEEWKREEYR